MSYTSRVAGAASLTMPETPQTYAEAVPEADPAAGGTDEEEEEEAQQDEPDLEPISLKEAPEEPLQVAGSEPVELVSESAPILRISSKDVPLTDSFLESAAATLGGLFLRGDQDEASQIIERLFQRFAVQTLPVRGKVVLVCKDLLKDTGFISQPLFVDRVTSQLLQVLVDEENSGLIKDINELLSKTATHLIQSGEYARAG